MDEIGDYLYIILLIVFSLVGLLKKKKLPSVAPQTQPEVDEYEEADDDLFPPVESPGRNSQTDSASKKISWPTYETAKQEKPSVTIFERNNDSYETATDVSKVRAKMQIKSNVSDKRKPNLNIENESESHVTDYSLDSIEEVRRAIIFSEIINRKY